MGDWDLKGDVRHASEMAFTSALTEEVSRILRRSWEGGLLAL